MRENGQILEDQYEPDGIRIRASVNRQYQKTFLPIVWQEK